MQPLAKSVLTSAPWLLLRQRSQSSWSRFLTGVRFLSSLKASHRGHTPAQEQQGVSLHNESSGLAGAARTTDLRVSGIRDGSVSHAIRTAARHVAAAPMASLGTALAGAALHITAVAALKFGVSLPVNAEARKISRTFHAERAVGQVCVDQIENLVFLDDSDSMNGDHFWEARKAFSRMASDLGNFPTRVIKFGSSPTVLTSRSEAGAGEAAALAAAAEWNGSSGGTFMWKMIEDDIFNEYAPGRGRLRVFLVTDGMDELSPVAYRGTKGMKVMLKSLRDAGFNLEFYVVVVGPIVNTKGNTDHYQDLAKSTGGAFLSVGFLFDELEESSRAFLSTLAESSAAGSAHQQRLASSRAHRQLR